MPDRASTQLADAMQRGDVFSPDCPSRAIIRHVTSSWGLLSLIALRRGTLRFSELRRRVSGVSERMLAQTLQQLEGDGLVSRKSYPVVPPHVEYSLTEAGREAAELVERLAEWVQDRMPALVASRAFSKNDDL